MTNEIKVAPMHKLIKRAGAARVSEESATALGRALEEIWFGPYFERLRSELLHGNFPAYCVKCNPEEVVRNHEVRLRLTRELANGRKDEQTVEVGRG